MHLTERLQQNCWNELVANSLCKNRRVNKGGLHLLMFYRQTISAPATFISDRLWEGASYSLGVLADFGVCSRHHSLIQQSQSLYPSPQEKLQAG